ncbi:FAD binding domain protein [delta proteobacterium NaphS2]|nr:FAD binding domain protein [delta proteobacterium NaphS2]
MDNYDVVIVGSGPCGASAAKTLKGHGVKVLVVEKKKLPREKICSGLILPCAQKQLSEYFGTIPEECYSEPRLTKGLKLVAPDESIIDVPPEAFKEGENATILSVWRSRFDSWLVEESGALVMEQCRFAGFREEDGGMVVNLYLEGREVSVKTKYIIGADGGSSRVRSLVAPEFNMQDFCVVVYEEQWIGTIDMESEYFYAFSDKKYSEFPFAALNVKDDVLIAANGGWYGCNVRDLHEAFLNYLKESHGLKLDRRVRSGGCIMNAGSYKNRFDLGKDRVLLAGEAAGFLGGFCEGITTALITGRIAANAIIDSMKSGEKVLLLYSSMVEDEKQRILAQLQQGTA